MQKDAHMLLFEAVRKRSYRLANAAERTESLNLSLRAKAKG